MIKTQNRQARKPAKAFQNLLAMAHLMGPFTDHEVYCCLNHRYRQVRNVSSLTCETVMEMQSIVLT